VNDDTPDAAGSRATAGGASPGWHERIRGLITVVPPVTVITAVLLWYGYVATLQRFRYFGVSLDMTGLSNQSLLLYGAETVYPVAALLLLALLGALLAHVGVARLLASSHHTLAWTLAALAATAGVLLVGRALIGMLRPQVAATETPGVTPLSLTAGAPLLVYAAWIARRSAVLGSGDGSWWAGAFPVRAERTAMIVAAGILAVGLFWTANSFAGAYGTGRAQADAENLSRRPEVVLFTREPLPAVPSGVGHADLGPGTPYRHRYGGLRLLLVSDGRLYLVPAGWSADASTLVIPYDSGIRMQLLPPRP
jgi:hypothetical protein